MRTVRFGAFCRVLVLAIAPAFFASSVSAQIVEHSRTLADLLASHPCNSGLAGRHTIVTDCDAADDLGDGEGAFSCFARCDGVDTWAAVSIGGGGGGTIGGSTGSTDNAILAADGTGGATLQTRAITISDVSGFIVALASTPGNALSLVATAPAATTGASQAGTAASLTASPAVASTDTAGAAAGGSVTITGGAAARNTSGNANGGDINLVPGAGIGTGTAGSVVIPAGTAAAPSLSFTGDPDTGLFTDSANSFKFTTAGINRVSISSTGMLGLVNTPLFGFYVQVDPNTAGSGSPHAMSVGRSMTITTNEGSTAENYHTLPSAVAGYNYTFIVQDADGIRITAAAGDTIRPIAGTAASAAGGFIRCATQGAFITLVAINATEWVAIGSAGTWTIDV